MATSYIELGHSKQICVKCLDQNFTFYYEEHQDLEIKLERRINVATPLCYVPSKLFSSFIFYSVLIHLFIHLFSGWHVQFENTIVILSVLCMYEKECRRIYTI